MSYIKNNDISTKRVNYLVEDFYKQNKEQLVSIAKRINSALKDCPHFDGIEYDDVGGKTIQIMFYNTETYGSYPSGYAILYKDLSNADEAVERVIQSFKRGDTAENIMLQNKFFKDGEENDWH